jgi:hypothetical protein
MSQPRDKNNNFNALRFLFASLVILSHAPELQDGDRRHELLTQIFGTISYGGAKLLADQWLFDCQELARAAAGGGIFDAPNLAHLPGFSGGFFGVRVVDRTCVWCQRLLGAVQNR